MNFSSGVQLFDITLGDRDTSPADSPDHGWRMIIGTVRRCMSKFFAVENQSQYAESGILAGSPVCRMDLPRDDGPKARIRLDYLHPEYAPASASGPYHECTMRQRLLSTLLESQSARTIFPALDKREINEELNKCYCSSICNIG